jgi:16S rRNA (cytidine1402-2'-O)-methyltransferase
MGTLYVVATPIGNLEDISFRALRLLFTVDMIACEDTRQTGQLLTLLRARYGALIEGDKRPELIRYDNHTEQSEAPRILEAIEEGKNVALVSDAGTPIINDPGYVIVSNARKHGIPVESVPGPSAPIAALAASGLPADKFTFLGYPPEKQAHRLKLFASLLDVQKSISPTYICFCAPHKLAEVLDDMATALGDIEITIMRELTKSHEAWWKGPLSEATSSFAEPKGEMVLLFDLRG